MPGRLPKQLFRMPIVKAIRTDNWVAVMYGIRDVLMFPPDVAMGDIWEGLYAQIGRDYFIGPMFDHELEFALKPFLEYFSIVDLRSHKQLDGQDSRN